jgi:hypothetical protein
MLELNDAERTVLEALSVYVVEGRLGPLVSIGELFAQTGLCRDAFDAAFRGLIARNWIAPGLPDHWTEDHVIGLQGEGLARAAAIATRRDLTLFEVQVADICFFVSYEEPTREHGKRTWTARAHRADAPGSAPEATAIGITRAKARDALVQKLGTLFNQPTPPVIPCDVT